MSAMSAISKRPKGFGILLPYQRRWIEDESKVKVCVKSRGAGLSWAEACGAVELASSDGGCDVWYIGCNDDLAVEFIDRCAFWVKEQRIADAKRVANSLVFATGRKIAVLPPNPRNLRGKVGKVVIENAAFLQDLPGLLDAAIALTLWGGQVSIISEYSGREDCFYRLVQDIREGKLSYSLHDNLNVDAP